MSTVSGVFPNAITPTFAPSSDPAQQARLRRQDETAVFSPVEELEQNTESRRTNIEQPGRLEAEQSVNTASQLTRRDDTPVEETREVRGEPAQAQSDEPQADSAQQQREVQREQQDQAKQAQEEAKLQEEIELVRELAARDREVRAHEQAHQSVGGQYAGAMEFTFQRGPDGKRYAVGGEVSIDVSKVPGDPQATLDKADRVRRAALAPAEPSAQDRRVASLASQISIEAQNDIRQMERMEAEKAAEERAERREISEDENQKVESSDQTDEARTEEASEENSERLEEIFAKTSEAIEDALDAAYRKQPQQDIGFNLDTTV